MGDLERELEAVENVRERILRDLNEKNKRLEIDCNSCSDSHKVMDLTAIQTHWYTQSRGCSEGDYWNLGEMQFVCPETNVVNRLLFNNHDVPYVERSEYKNDPGAQFRQNYSQLFREVINTHKPNEPGWVNNFYVDSNRLIFGLSEKRRS